MTTFMFLEKDTIGISKCAPRDVVAIATKFTLTESERMLLQAVSEDSHCEKLHFSENGFFYGVNNR